MTTTLALLILAVLFAVFGVLRAPDRCERNCGSGSCSAGCRGFRENDHD